MNNMNITLPYHSGHDNRSSNTSYEATAWDWRHQGSSLWKVGIVLFNDTLNTFYFIEETWCCHYMGYSFWLAARNFYMHHPIERIAHTSYLCYISRGALAGIRNSSMCPLSEIDPMTHHTMSGCSTIELLLAPVYSGDKN